MIIVRLLGGMGNQMFQYALGRHLAHLHACKLKLDLSFLNNKYHNADVTIRKYELHKLNIIEDFTSQSDIDKFTKGTGFLSKINNKINPHYTLTEKQFHYDESVMNSPKNTYIYDGYWQTEKYFEAIEYIIREEFKVKAETKESHKHIEENINSTNSISIHVRRSDYVTNKLTNTVHGVCTKEYYDEAIKRIAKLIMNPVFFVFSDDIEWAKGNIKTTFPIFYVDNDVEANDEDLKLMSLCKHQIVANSSFSWWGAWLNNNKDKITIAPSVWFNDPKFDTKDLYIDGWIKI